VVDGIKSSQSLVYKYVSAVTIVKIEATTGSSTSMSLVTVTGSGIANAENLYCKDGHTVSLGTFVGASEMTCSQNN
jgi:hypothetical protein